jgi:hypothetical protein
VKCLRWIAVALFMVEAYHVAYYYPKDGFDVFLRYILPPWILIVIQQLAG